MIKTILNPHKPVKVSEMNTSYKQLLIQALQKEKKSMPDQSFHDAHVFNNAIDRCIEIIEKML